MTPFRCVLGLLLLLLTACTGGDLSPSASHLHTAGSRLTVEQGQQMQGQQMQGQQMQGQQMQGQQMQGTELISGTRRTEIIFSHRLTGVMLGGHVLEAVRVEQGELVAARPIPLSGTTASLTACAQPGTGLGRSCGWRSEGVGTCTPGAPVQVGAAQACGLGACTGDAMLRVCTGTSPCEHGPQVNGAAPQGMLAASDNACNSSCPAVDFPCPDSGRYNVLSASHGSTPSAAVQGVASAGSFPAREVLRGAQLAGAELVGESNLGGSGRYRITQVRPELAHHDTTGLGGTFLYTVEWQDTAGQWLPMCGLDGEGLQAAIPVGAMFDGTGARHESTTHFTFGCTLGVIAKCYRWGYKPWLLHPEDAALMRNLHWACTRMARADYCGNGTSHTRNGTLINFWDTVPPPGPLQTRGNPAPGMFFEAGWSTSGAVCLSKARWLQLPLEVLSACPDRLIPPGTSTGLATVCDSPAEALSLEPGARLFNESQLNGL